MFTEVIVFAGPSLTVPTRSGFVRVYPPAKRGDLRFLCGRVQSLIVFIDGLFFHTAAVTHAEILEVLNSGCAMIGAASMGALRAVELRHAGLIGVGSAYRALLQGYIIDDSEFAVGVCPYTHCATTISLVDVRGLLGKMATIYGYCDELNVAFEKARNIYFLDRTDAQLTRAWAHSCPRLGSVLVSALAHRAGFIKETDARLALRIAEEYLDMPNGRSTLVELGDRHPHVPIFHSSGVCPA
jgi:hypothetical protein